MTWLTDWDGEIDGLLDTFGEPVTWHPAGADDVALTAIVFRNTRGRDELGESSELRAIGTILFKRSDCPAAKQGDTVTLPPSRGAGSTETWVATREERDHGNGAVSFAIALYDARRHRTAGLERD